MPAAAPAIGITKNSTFGKRFKAEEFRIHTEMQPLIWLCLIHGTPPLQKSANFRHKYLAIFLSKDSIPHGLIIMPPIQRRFLYSITVIKLQLFIEPPFYYYCVLWPFWAVYRFVFDNFLFVLSFRAAGPSSPYGRLSFPLASVFWRKNLSKKRSLALFEVAKIGKTNYNQITKYDFVTF